MPRPWLPLDEAVVVVEAADEPEAEAEDAFGGGESERDGAEVVAAGDLAAPELFVDDILAPAGGGDDSESETDVGGEDAPVVDVGSGGDIESMVSE